MSSHLKEPISDSVPHKSVTKQQSETPQAALPSHTIKRASDAQDSLSHTEILQLQRTLGNRRVSSLLSNTPPIQSKLTVSPAGDQYEQEADQVAKHMVNRISSPEPQPAQRQEEEEELLQGKFESATVQRQGPEEEEELQMKPVQLFGGLSAQRQPEEDEEILQGKFETDGIQRQPPEEEELMTKPAIQRVGLEGGDVDSEMEASIQQAKGGGRPLPGNVRAPMENALGADFSGVKVHADSKSDSLNASLQSKAFTTGPNIFFKQGEYNPGSSGGRELIAHELTHVVQQGAGKSKTPSANGLERDDKSKR